MAVAQCFRRLAFNQWVRGSSLRRGNIEMDITKGIFQRYDLISGFLCPRYRFLHPHFPVLHALVGKRT